MPARDGASPPHHATASALRSCELCEHRCRVDRSREEGFCRLGMEARVYRAFLHHGEEAEISPTFAVFVSGCSLRCAYCSDGAWVEAPARAAAIDPATLVATIDAAHRGVPAARTVSFVGGNPDESLPFLLDVIRRLESPIPVVWNSNLYLAPEPLEDLVAHADIFVPDLKFGSDACAREIARVPRYVEVLHRNLRAVHGRRRLIVRHLLMPGHLDCCLRPVARFVAEELPEATLNLLTQYEPAFAGFPLPPHLARRPSQEEVEAAWQVVRQAGASRAWRDGRPYPDASVPSRADGHSPQCAGTPFESRILIRADGTVVLENAGERLEELLPVLAAFTGPGQGQDELVSLAKIGGGSVHDRTSDEAAGPGPTRHPRDREPADAARRGPDRHRREG